MENKIRQRNLKAPWRDRFLNIIERSIIELNIEFSNYSIGQAANGESKKRIFDKKTQGIEFADELTVCSAIVNDCISSPIISGDVEEPAKKGQLAELKFYKIQREVRYNEKQRDRVDITMERVSYEQIIHKAGNVPRKDGMEIGSYKKSYIEAKRAKRYMNSTLDKRYISNYSNSANELKNDIEYKIEHLYSPEIRFYILVWGVWDNEKEIDNTPTNYFKDFKMSSKFKIKRGDLRVRWIPLSWDSSTRLNVPHRSLTIGKWCWVVLAEINKR